MILNNDQERISVDHLSAIRPTNGQLAFMDWEFGAFFHFGIRSFFMGHRDWDNRPMPAEAFMPDQLDCGQWIGAVKAAGAKYAILVCKHHDGFANWPSRYTEYSVAASPWRGGRGDVVREFVNACRAGGLKVGLYYSPAQWGGGVPFAVDDAYDDYFIGQIGELLKNYGKIDYLWFDGCGSENHRYDTVRIIREIRAMQPEILIFNMWDPDTRWVGNEDGYAHMPNVYEVSAVDFSEKTTEKDPLNRRRFLPPECDFKMRSTWFDCEENEDTVKSPRELLGIYEMSVGRGANFLLNIGPNRHGLLNEADLKALEGFAALKDARYGNPLGVFGSAEPSGENAWSIVTGDSETAQAVMVNRLSVMEDLTGGQAVTAWAVYANLPCYRNQRIKLFEGETIGHRALISFPAVRTFRITVEVKTNGRPAEIREIKAFWSE